MRHQTVSGVLLLVTLVVCPSSGWGQEAGRTGVTFAYPAAIGVLWHVTDKVAVRPELSFAFTSTEGTGLESDSEALALGASALFYVKRWDTVSAYVSPRFAWARNSTTSQSNFPGPNSETEITGNSFLYSGSLGAQAWIGQRFSAFGEVGLGYTRGTAKSSLTGFETTNTTVATRAGVGVALYF
jgi:hypothetical protein